MVVITETWLHNNISDDCIVPPGYRMFRKDRNTRGGGVCIIVKNSVYAVMMDCDVAETIWCKIKFHNVTYIVGAVYRAPSASPEFLEELNTFLCTNIKANTRLIMTGDFNLPHINWQSPCSVGPDSSSAAKLVEIMFTCNLSQIVQDDTRITPKSRSLLDLVFLSNTINAYTVNVEDGVSDHKMIVVTITVEASDRPRPYIPVRIKDYERADDNSILDYLESAFDGFEINYNTKTVEELWRHFKIIVQHCVDSYIPTRVKKTKHRSPWITRDIIHMKRKIKRLRKKKNKTSQLVRLRAELKQTLKESKKKFFDETLCRFLRTSPQKFWRYFSDRKEQVQEIRKEDEVLIKKEHIADHFNRFFQSVFTANDDDVNLSTERLLPSQMDNIIITQEGVFQQLLNLDAKKSNGPDNIPTQFLQRYAEWASRYLQLIFEKSLQTHSVPQDWRSAVVIPVFKGGSRTLVNNYRPISLTSISCKLMEHIIAKHILRHLETNCLLYPHQHGFRTGLSTTTQLVETIHAFAMAIDARQQTDVIAIDFAKAFDKVPHNKLLYKLETTGLNATIIKWIKAYLTNRSQVVRMDGHVSGSLAVLSGVPQGSVLGPLLFLVYINDISTVIEPDVQLKLFADDCLIYSTVRNTDDQLKVNNCLKALSGWCKKWNMEINYSKSTYTHITKKKCALSFPYAIGDKRLINTRQFKYLGVTITHNLEWSTHIDDVCSKAYGRLCFLRKKLEDATRDVRLTAYKTFVRPLLEYASVVWSPHQIYLKKQLERIQRYAARFICSRYRRTDSVTEMLCSCNLDLLETRRQKLRLKLLFQILQGQINIRKETYIRAPGKRSSRTNHSQVIQPYSARSDTFKHSFFPHVIEMWNILPMCVVKHSDVSEFERALDDHLYECCI